MVGVWAEAEGLAGMGQGQAGGLVGMEAGRRAVSVPALSPILTPHSSQAVRKPLAWLVGVVDWRLQLHKGLAQPAPLPLLHALGAREMRRAAGEASRPQQVKGIHSNVHRCVHAMRGRTCYTFHTHLGRHS